jgi:hypothetical protein
LRKTSGRVVSTRGDERFAFNTRGAVVATIVRALAAGLAAVVVGLQPAVALGQADPAEADEAAPEGPRPDRGILLIVRLDPGLFVSFGRDETVRFLCDVGVALRYDLTHGNARLSLVPEVGYTYHDGDAVGGHYGSAGIGLRYGTAWIAVNPSASVLLGERAERFDLGVRAGARLLAALDLIGLEVAYELRTPADGSDQVHALVVALVVDLGILLMPMLLTRLGWSFGRAAHRTED